MQNISTEDFEFLRLVAKVYVDNYNDLNKFCFVFPNRRSIKFFQKYLGIEYGKKHQKPLISPQLITINDLFIKLSGLQQVDNIDALYILYNLYVKLRYPNSTVDNEQQIESFDDFINWGDLILRDFDDIDKYLVDAKQLFTNIKDLKELDGDYSFLSKAQIDAIEGFWKNFLKGEFTEKKAMFASMWSIMYNLYLSFKEALINRNLCYEGQMYRMVAENLNKDNYVDHSFGTLVFIGLNAPNKCERALMTFLKNSNRAHFYWDYYGSLLTNKENSASNIISQLVIDYPSEFEINNNLEIDNLKKDIKVIGVPSSVGQAFVVSSILKDLASKEEVTKEQAFKTCVLLPDEKLLIPILNSIPKQYKSINVTMGYPISSTTFISFMNLISQMHRDIKLIDEIPYFYHKSVLELLNHNYILNFAKDLANKIRTHIISSNKVYIAYNDSLLCLQDSPFLSLIFKPITNTTALIEYQEQILRYLNEHLDSLEKEFLYQYYLRINRLKDLNIPMEIKTYFKLLSKITSSITVPFRGEPLQGLQIMGTLEIRALDFDNLIITSVNEGVFPSSINNDSLIPYNLRYGFGLPTYELRDGIAAYHFYRSIARAKRIYLIFDTRSEGLNTGEVSRYVKQLKYHFNLEVDESVVAYSPIINSSNDIEIVKDERITQLLYKKYLYTGSNYVGKSSLSASAVNNYITCPLKFYFQNVENIKEEEQVSERLESDTFGSLFHNTMEHIYKEYENEIISKSVLESIISRTSKIEDIIVEQFREILKVESVSGQNLITKELIKKYVLLTLKVDLQYCPFMYIQGEKKYTYKLDILDNSYRINFKAFLDRIDVVGDKLRIVDYKTGSVEKLPSQININSIFDNTSDSKYRIILQMFLYALMLVEHNDSKYYSQNTDLCIYPIKTIAHTRPLSINFSTEDLEDFKSLLKKTVEEIFNPNVAFIANKGCKACEYCNFSNFCGQ